MAYDLHPSRGLLHPAWLASLGVLALNDHVLKGADLLPGALTGKLSDVAGMLVAPLLLAAVLRVRRMPGWVACHLAVGAVFAAIQLSAPAAEAWSAAMGFVGFPWVITQDVTDLAVLPVLALSLWGLLPAMRRRAAANARRSAELGAASVGMLCCVATSDVDEPLEPQPWEDTDGWDDPEPPPQELPPINADVYISNATAQTQVVRIRPLRTDIAVDCEAIAESPGTLLRSSLFEPASAWTVPPNANIPVVDHSSGERWCYAAWIEADVLEPVIAMWMDGSVSITSVPGEGQWGLPGELQLRGGAEGLSIEGDPSLIHAQQDTEPAAEGSCAPQPDGDRIGWSTPVPWGAATITAVEAGVDGCLAVDLARGAETDETWYLCVPQTSFPFQAGDEIDVRLVGAAPGETALVDAIEIVTVDELGEAQALPSLTVSAGAGLPAHADLELAALPLFSCDITSEPVCGTVERPLSLIVGGDDLEAIEVEAADGTQRIAGEGRFVEVTLMHAQERFVVDPLCALGPVDRGLDLELAIAQWPALEG